MSKSQIIIVLKITCFCLFAGRAWQHIIWDAPFRALLWDEQLMKGIIEMAFGMNWQDYVSSGFVDRTIQNTIKGFGWFYVVCATCSLIINERRKWAGYVLLIGSVSLAFLAFLYCKEKSYRIGDFFEYAIQVASPIFLWLIIFKTQGAQNLAQSNTEKFLSKNKLKLLMKIAIALTFTSHGLYAIGYYPHPGSFVDMVINSFGVTEPTAHHLLFIVGVLDFLVSILIFIPKVAKPALIYIVFWGLLTALARVYANFYSNFALETISQWLHETLWRLPHAGLPVVVLLLESSTTFRLKKLE
ncbi:MAG: hypothetical protein COA57_06450 [Flavobacteriales bacterium]|nr:hypothetical protein [Bacteroidales bacterium AH-315-I05]PCJ86360.1 MAG: hypothetical protein COA57_06450 [Flavobacteriales bacterium]